MRPAELSFRTRRASLEALSREVFDLVVLGGGITGAGIARDAALRGLRRRRAAGKVLHGLLCLSLLGLGGLHLSLEFVRALEQRRALLRGSLANLLAKSLLLPSQLIGLSNRRAPLLISREQRIN